MDRVVFPVGNGWQLCEGGRAITPIYNDINDALAVGVFMKMTELGQVNFK